MSPPTIEIQIETPRLVLTPPAECDFEAVHAMSADPEMFHYSERGPMSSDEAWARLLRHIGHWAVAGYGVFVIRDKATGRFLGESGFCEFRRGLGPRFDGRPEMTWSIVPHAQGWGCASEAAEAAQRWMDARAPTLGQVCLVHSENRPSLRLAEKLGYRPFHRQAYKGYPALLLSRDPIAAPS